MRLACLASCSCFMPNISDLQNSKMSRASGCVRHRESGIFTHLTSLQSVGKVSGAARGLCLWVRAMETYGTVARDVAPKRAKLKAAQDNLAKKQTALAAAQQQLAEVLAKVQKLKVGI